MVVVLGGGAVVRECFVPALDRLGLLGRTTIVDPRAGPLPAGRVLAIAFDEFLSAGTLDGLTHCVVALPNALHVRAVRMALEAGLHVLCEKPLALRRDECEELAALADARQRVLAVNMVRRLFRSVRAAATAVRRGWVGELRAIRIAHGSRYGWPVSSIAPFERQNGGVLADMGVHYLDIAEMLAGALTPVRYQDDHAGGVESDCEFLLRSASGVQVDIAVSRLRTLSNEIRLVGSSGQIRVGVDAFDQCVFEALPEDGGQRDMLSLGDGTGRTTRFSDYFADQLERFLHAPFGSQEELAGARSAARTAGLVEWAYASRETPHTSVAVSRPDTVRLEPGPVYVTGATGFIGAHVIDRLAQDGADDITGGYRSLAACASISRYPVRYHATNLLDPDQVREAVRGRRYVFHLAYGRDSDAERVTVDGTRHVVEACIAEGVEAVVVLSTMYVLGHPGGVVDESAAYDPVGGEYGRTKADMERWCLERAKTSGNTRIVVLLPTCVYGPRGQTYTEVPVSLAREGRFCWIENGRGIANITYVENLVDAIVRAATTPDAHGRRYIINDECLSWRDFLTPMLGPWIANVPAVGRREFRALATPPQGPGLRDVATSIVRSREVRDTLARTWAANQLRPLVKKYAPSVVSRLNEASSGVAVMAAPRAIPPDWLEVVFGPTVTEFSSAQARRVLQWTPSISRNAAMDRTVAWLRDQGLYESVGS